MFELGTKLIRIQTGQHYVIDKTELVKVKGTLFKKEVLYHLKHESGPIDLTVHEDELKNLFKFAKQTNADRIRAMSDEELAKFIYSQAQARCSARDCVGADTCYYHADWNGECGDTCEQAIKRWLQSEAEEVSDE